VAAADRLKNIRPRDANAALLLTFGADRSPAFRELVRALEDSHVIVYVDARLDAAHPVGGALSYLGEVGGYRWVRAVVDSGTGDLVDSLEDIVRLTAILGHELRHAVEAGQAPHLATLQEFERYFRAIGDGPRGVLDTRAARDTGELVEDELRGT
jgi:hypothetical protein